MKSVFSFFEVASIKEKRTLKNKPNKTSIREWMQIEKDDRFKDEPWYDKGNWGKSKVDGKYYGWSHRAIFGFYPGHKVKSSTGGNPKDTEWTIKSDKDAAMMAALFSKSVS
ncbi:MAG: hypothetical protein ACOC2W_00770 [bacterium]